MNANALTDADFAELARRWEDTPQHETHLRWQSRIRAQQGTAPAPVPDMAPVPATAPVQMRVTAPVQLSLFD